MCYFPRIITQPRLSFTKVCYFPWIIKHNQNLTLSNRKFFTLFKFKTSAINSIWLSAFSSFSTVFESFTDQKKKTELLETDTGPYQTEFHQMVANFLGHLANCGSQEALFQILSNISIRVMHGCVKFKQNPLKK